MKVQAWLTTSPRITESSLLIPKDVFLCSAAFLHLSFHTEAQWLTCLGFKAQISTASLGYSELGSETSSWFT